MKKKTILIAIVALVVILVGVNLYLTRAKEEQYKASAVSIKWSDSDEEILFSSKELTNISLVQVDATFQRKVGPPEPKNYQGIALSTLLEKVGASKEQLAGVVVTSRDQYSIELSPDEVFEPNNIYLVTQENGEPLATEEGIYKLVICKDKLSTRWVKQVVSIELLKQ